MSFLDSERPRSLLLSLGGAIRTLAWVLSWDRPGPIPGPRWSRPDSPCALFSSILDPSRSRGGGHPGPSWSHPAPEQTTAKFTAKKGNFTPTPSAPTPCKTSRRILGEGAGRTRLLRTGFFSPPICRERGISARMTPGCPRAVCPKNFLFGLIFLFSSHMVRLQKSGLRRRHQQKYPLDLLTACSSSSQ